MPINLPTIDTSKISFGPGRLFLGTAGTTPTVDVGSIAPDGISFSISKTVREIRQGNPQLVEEAFAQVQDLSLKVTGIEWNVTNLAYGLGAGATSSSASADTWEWGGDPLITKVAIQVQHQMGFAAGQTLNVNVWKAYADGGIEPKFGMEEHSFGYSYKAVRSATNWAGSALASTKQLVLVQRQKT